MVVINPTAIRSGRWFSPGPPVSSINKTESRYNWNIVESGVKYHKTNQQCDHGDTYCLQKSYRAFDNVSYKIAID
jgi:hypothetical protein